MTKSRPFDSQSLRTNQTVQRGPMLQFVVNGQLIDAFGGESVAAALFAAGFRELRRSHRDGTPRGLFCMMGSCQECVVWVGDRQMPACQVPVTSGLEVQTIEFRNQNCE